MAWSGPSLLGSRLVVVSPHPDDEVLCAGGLMRWTAHHGCPVVVVAVTDGEMSHATSDRVRPDELRDRRAAERTEALARLGVPEVEVVRLGMPDRECSAHLEEITADLRLVLAAADVVIGPTVHDRHPDHVAVAAAIAAVGPDVLPEWWEAPTWALVHGTAEPPGRALALDGTAWAAKRHAMTAYRSQLHPLGPDPQDGPVVHPHELDAMLRPVEAFVGRRCA